MLVPVALSVILLVAVLAFSGAVLARHRAQAAADLAALAASERVETEGTPDCSVAARVAGLNGGRLTACRENPDGSVVVSVEVRARIGAPGAGVGTARGEARAGPCPAC